MKKILLSLLIAGSLFACGDKNEPDNGSKIKSPDQLEKIIRVRGVKSLSLRAAENTVMGYDSLAFITRYGIEFSLTDNKTGQTGLRRSFGFLDDWFIQRDTINNALLLLDDDVLQDYDKDGILQLGFFITDVKDVVLLGYKKKDGTFVHAKNWTNKGIVYDTVGYIPNKIRVEVSEKITKAFNKQDYSECQRLFKDAFVFLPTTGVRWRALKDAGIE